MRPSTPGIEGWGSSADLILSVLGARPPPLICMSGGGKADGGQSLHASGASTFGIGSATRHSPASAISRSRTCAGGVRWPLGSWACRLGGFLTRHVGLCRLVMRRLNAVTAIMKIREADQEAGRASGSFVASRRSRILKPQKFFR